MQERRDRNQARYPVEHALGSCETRAVVELSGVSIPAGDVGGDLLEMFPVNENELAFYVADVIGKGEPASSLGTVVRAAFRDASGGRPSPAAVCHRVNRVLCTQFTGAQFATGFYGVLDHRTGWVRYTRAGHTPGLLVRADGAVVRLMDGGGILGAFGGLLFSEGQVRLSPGDRLLLYTDGLTEATDADGQELGEAGVADLLQQHRRLGAQKLQRTLLTALERYCLRDDVTVGVLAAA